MIVYKYRLNPIQATQIELPIDAMPLRVDVQNGVYYLWALVNPGAKTELRTFEIFGTGHSMPDLKYQFINTFLVKEIGDVCHAFEHINSTK